jgi:hypothetical protein
VFGGDGIEQDEARVSFAGECRPATGNELEVEKELGWHQAWE